MIFSSTLFLYLFLPLTLLGYYLVRESFRNYWLLIASLIFFAWGGVGYTVILIGSIVMNYFFGLLIQQNIGRRTARHWLTAGVTANLLLLCVFKYANFITKNLNYLLGFVDLPKMEETHIILPIGISFYTFHSLSYLVDIYRQKTTAQKNIIDLSLYIAMFSQLIAGPIIRYSDVWQQLSFRPHSWPGFARGVERFLIGLGKKVLIANTLGHVADGLFALNYPELGALNAWLGIVAYTFQIYCDFSGYSDMAIGLGKMFGFDFMENFNYPYLSRSVKEFWRRWHISLSTFFRDYVYIPLGGNRVGQARQYLNLVIVFFLTGFWHGAGWNFVAWGLVHGFFMLLERFAIGKPLQRLWPPLANLYTFMVVLLAWVLFRVSGFRHGLDYYKAMFDFHVSPQQMAVFYSYVDNEFLLALLISILGSFGLFRQLEGWVKSLAGSAKSWHQAFCVLYQVSSSLVYAIILLLASMYLVAGSYNPFIYYRF